MKRKVAIVVQGRFYAFDLGKALLAQGHDVHLFTNYPRWAMERFGFPRERVQGFWPHGVAVRVSAWLHRVWGTAIPEPGLHEWFGRWAARVVARETWDAVFCFSGVAEELFRGLPAGSRWLIRGSTHIRVQAALLAEEERRAGVAGEHPSEWMIAREEREYGLADYIVVLSDFARRSFAEQGVVNKVRVIPLGVELDEFRATPAEIAERCERIRSNRRLRLLFVGTKSYRKGLLDLQQIVTQLADRFECRVVGPVEKGAEDVVRSLGAVAEVIPAVPQAELRAHYAWGDVFVFPTIEDGFAVVLAHAQASGLPILTTPNCGGPELITDSVTGWILPIRSPGKFIAQLEWCAVHRSELAGMVERIHADFQSRTWADVARDHEAAWAAQEAAV